MKKYSEFFQTLHDESKPTGHLGRGTHYSILRALVWHDNLGNPTKEAKYLDFAVIWDEDHDERVIEAIEKMYIEGLLTSAIFIGERKGHLSVICHKIPFSSYEQKISSIADGKLDDSWGSEVTNINDEEQGIINDNYENVRLYLRNLDMLWKLGIKDI